MFNNKVLLWFMGQPLTKINKNKYRFGVSLWIEKLNKDNFEALDSRTNKIYRGSSIVNILKQL